jgi:fumarate hydratase class I
MARFSYAPFFPLKRDTAKYRKLAGGRVRTVNAAGRTFLRVDPESLSHLAEEAFTDVSFFLRTRHLEGLVAILDDPEASENDRFVAAALLRNAAVSAEGELPLCQDTGTATIIAHKGEGVLTGADDARFLSRGVFDAYRKQNLRYSQVAPLGMLDEKNTGTNLPAQIDIYAEPGAAYKFLFVAKGGGSSNKTSLYQENKSLLLSERTLLDFLAEKITAIGVAACPPYRLAVVIGGTSPEGTLKTVKLASAGYLDNLAAAPTAKGQAYRDFDWEKKILDLARKNGLGAQFTGKYFALEARVVRMPRHAASLPVGIGVSCNADRNIRGKITRDGIFLEKLDRDPGRFLAKLEGQDFGPVVMVDIDRPIDKVVATLSAYPVGTRLSLTGTLVVARDIAHARLKKILDEGRPLPAYFRDHPIYYAGPAKAPRGRPTGSIGPTTAQRMDGYIAEFMSRGASRITLAKGGRAAAALDACRRYNGFYLGTIGGAAALVADKHITASEVIDFEDLGMEAIRMIRVEGLPAFILYDNKGNSLYG